MNQNGRCKWHISHPLGDGVYIMTCREDGKLRHALLYIHTFRLMAPRKLLEAQLFNKQYGSYEDIDNIPDRLRFCRHRLGLMQKEVARMAGISRNTYINLETGNLNSFNKAAADKLATIFEIPVYDLLDGYNRFLCDGQAQRIKEYRASFGLGQKPFARQMGIPIRCLQDWESGRKVVSLKSWEKYFKDRIST